MQAMKIPLDINVSSCYYVTMTDKTKVKKTGKSKAVRIGMQQTELQGDPYKTVVRIEKDLYQRLQEEAWGRKVSVNFVIREALLKVYGSGKN